jgi:hypothetical protein
MPDILTPKERAMIDEALRAGKVTQCPPQKCAIPPNDLADPRKRKRNRFRNYVRGQRLRAADAREQRNAQ